MMKSFFKKLSVAMALALVLGTTAQAGVAKAADTWSFKKNSKILYLNEDNTSGTSNTYDFDFKKGTLPTDWKDVYTFTWTSDNEKVAVVGKGGVVTAVSVGKAVIKCSVVDKATGKEVATASAPVTVKENAEGIYISNYSEYADTVVAPGTVVDLDRTMYNSNYEETTKRGELVTDYTRWIAEDAEGNVVDAEAVTIDQTTGKFTMNKVGTYRLYAETYQSEKNPQTTATSGVVYVTVAETETFTAAQKSVNTFELDFGTELEKVPENFLENLVVAVTENYVSDEMVRSAALSGDKTKVVVTMWNNFENKTEYKATYTEGESTKEATFVASVGAPAAIEITSKAKQGKNVVFVADDRIESNALEIKFFDAAGIDVTSLVDWSLVEFVEPEDDEDADTFTFSSDVENKTFELIASEAKKAYTLKATYSVYDDEKGESIVIAQGSQTFIARESGETSVSKSDVAAAGLYGNATDTYDTIVKNGVKNVIAANDAAKYFVVAAVDNWGSKVDSTSGDFSFKSSNEEVAMIDEFTGEFTPNKPGSVVVTVFYTDPYNDEAKAKAVGQYKVTVKQDREAAKLDVNEKTGKLDAQIVAGETDATKLAVNVVNKVVFDVKVTDTLGDNFTSAVVNDIVVDNDCFEIVGYNKDKGAVEIKLSSDNANLNEVLAKDTNKTVKVSTTISLAGKDGVAFEQKITVTVKKPSTVEVKKYKVDVADADISTAANNGATTVKLYGLNKDNVVVKAESDILYSGIAANDFAATQEEGTFFYTISKEDGKTLINADGSAVVTATSGAVFKVKGEVMKGETSKIDLVTTYSSEQTVASTGSALDVTVKAKAATYKVNVYQVVKKGDKLEAKALANDTFTVKDSVGAPSVTQNKTKTELSVADFDSNKLEWTNSSDIADVLLDCFTIKVGDYTVSENDPMFFNVRLNGNKLFIKSVKVFTKAQVKDADGNVVETNYVERVANVGKTITLE